MPPAHSLPLDFGTGLPTVTRLALADLKAPDFDETQDFVDWAEREITITAKCGGDVTDEIRTSGFAKAPRTGRRTHVVQINPHTGAATTLAASARSGDDVAATHMLWALSADGTPNACDLIATIVNTSVGDVGNGAHFAGHSWDRRRMGHLFSVRTLVRTVQYLDAGFSPVEQEHWLAMGVPAPLLAEFFGGFAEGVFEEVLLFDALKSAVDSGELPTVAAVRNNYLAHLP